MSFASSSKSNTLRLSWKWATEWAEVVKAAPFCTSHRSATFLR
jgi:hypothetical protein